MRNPDISAKDKVDMPIDDETLMAFADGALPPDAARAVADAVAADSALAARVALFRQTRAALKSPPPMPSAGDAALIARIRAAQMAQPAAAPPPPSPARPANRNWVPQAVAASLVLVLALGLGLRMGGPGTDGPGLPAEVIAALGTVPMAETQGNFTAIASFQTESGGLCREYETAEPPELGLACHENGAWVRRFAAPLAPTDGYAPASGTVEKIEALLRARGAGAALTPEEEAIALTRLP
ncbi:MAG: hypothetical protein Q4G26_15320 [Paracoccus sp. (in: a-proteobacteria)]|nr:hypothetical protein [Paracoccus sp. (in: a-proteobacteria)]